MAKVCLHPYQNETIIIQNDHLQNDHKHDGNCQNQYRNTEEYSDGKRDGIPFLVRLGSASTLLYSS
jgi:hypothetical protein